jgi:hypothetical protein
LILLSFALTQKKVTKKKSRLPVMCYYGDTRSVKQAIQLASLKQNRLLHATGITSALRTSQEAGLGLFDHHLLSSI